MRERSLLPAIVVAERCNMPTTSNKLTVAEFATYAAEHGRCELINGEVVPLSPTGGRHGNITSRLHILLGQFVYSHDLGEVFAAETGFRLDAPAHQAHDRPQAGPTVRAPDIAFIAKERAAQADTAKFIAVPPDLAVETLSPDDRVGAVREKVQWWLTRGTKLVWVVDPENRTVTVHKPGEQPRLLGATDILGGDSVVPGFELALSRLFT